MARQRGARNKRTTEFVRRCQMEERRLKKEGKPHNIISVLYGLLASAEADIQLRAAATLLKYQYPVLKAITVDGATGEPVNEHQALDEAEGGQMRLVWDADQAQESVG